MNYREFLIWQVAILFAIILLIWFVKKILRVSKEIKELDNFRNNLYSGQHVWAKDPNGNMWYAFIDRVHENGTVTIEYRPNENTSRLQKRVVQISQIYPNLNEN